MCNAFLGMVVKTIKNGLNLPQIAEVNMRTAPNWSVFGGKCDVIRAWRRTPRELWTKEKICPLCLFVFKIVEVGLSTLNLSFVGFVYDRPKMGS